MIQVLSDPSEKSALCENILRSLPQWFGNEAALLDYARQAGELPVAAFYEGGEAIGFLALKAHTPFAMEVCVMGVLPQKHRKGAGRALIGWASDAARGAGAALLTVKTLAPTDPDEGYARTRRFYTAMGFMPVEVFPDYWDSDNPCLLMAKIL